jgi:hypothetical protein
MCLYGTAGGTSCSSTLKEVDPIDMPKIISNSDDNQPFLWNDIEELPKVSSGVKVVV